MAKEKVIGVQPTATIPSFLPVPATGRHLDPGDGACLMEAAAFLAGERFSDHPRCVHPTLAALSRVVNDTVSPACRWSLRALLPDLIGLRGVGAGVAPRLVLHVLEFARGRGRIGALGELARRRARRRITWLDQGGLRARWVTITDGAYRGPSAERTMMRALAGVAGAVAGSDLDGELADLLRQCVELTQVNLSGAAELVPRSAAAAAVAERRG